MSEGIDRRESKRLAAEVLTLHEYIEQATDEWRLASPGFAAGTLSICHRTDRSQEFRLAEYQEVGDHVLLDGKPVPIGDLAGMLIERLHVDPRFAFIWEAV